MEVSGHGANPASQPQATAPPAGKKDFLETFTVLPEGRFRTTPSGLKVAVMAEGQGSPVSTGVRVKMQYTGWLEDGTQFDSSVGKGQPFEFVLGSGQVIKGWEEGVAGMKVGERRQIIVPPTLGYGGRKVGKIPPNSTLIFNVEAVGMEGGGGKAPGNLSIVA